MNRFILRSLTGVGLMARHSAADFHKMGKAGQYGKTGESIF
jgi:hypothetical protein